MKEAGLPAPEYIEDPNTVRLILRNNIDERMPHRNKASGEAKNEALNDALSKDKKVIIAMIHVRPEITQTEIVDASKFSRSKVQRLIKSLLTEILSGDWVEEKSDTGKYLHNAVYFRNRYSGGQIL